jgi:hypothetical protein
MTKYKLIKEYPGSPELGTVAEKESKIKSNTSYYYSDGDKRWCIYDYHVEENPEYWEKVNENLWWVVTSRDYQTGTTRFEAWYIYKVETCNPKIDGVLNYFKTEQEAEEYILYNKPCISINDIKDNVSECFLNKLIRIVKSKL